MKSRAAIVTGVGALVLGLVAVVVAEALTHSGIGMWVGFGAVAVITIVVGSRLVGRYGGPGGGGGSGGCGPGGC